MNQQRCLVIFDADKNATKNLATALPSSDYQIHYCTSLEDVFDVLSENVVDLFFLDISTLEEHAADVLNELDLRSKRSLKILTYSHQNPEDLTVAQSDNVYAVVKKPFVNLEVKKVIQGALRVRDLTKDLETAQAHVSKDSETGLYTESYLMDRVQAEFKRAERYYYPLTLCVFDIFVQQGNRQDSLNRAESLKVTSYLKQLIRDNDVLVQSNEGHYFLLLPDTRKKGAEVLSMRIVSGVRRELSPKVFSDGRSFKLYAGYVSYPEDGVKEADALLKLGQYALDQAQKEKQSGTIFSFPGMDLTGFAPQQAI